MHHFVPPALYYSLALADGSRWAFAAVDAEAASVVAQLGDAMQLRAVSSSVAPVPADIPLLLVRSDWEEREPPTHPLYAALPSIAGHRSVYIRPPDPHDGAYIQLLRLALVFAQDAQTRGGMLIHGALAERHGRGVILAAPGGRGKSTASNRLVPPWCSRCDDTTLVVPDAHGRYWAHPWPTWSRFVCREAGGGSWEVQRAVPLEAIFILSQARDDRVEQIGRGEAVSLLVQCAEQAALFMGQGASQAARVAIRRERFDNLCALARRIPTSILHISLTGAFWDEIALALDENDDRHKAEVITWR